MSNSYYHCRNLSPLTPPLPYLLAKPKNADKGTTNNFLIISSTNQCFNLLHKGKPTLTTQATLKRKTPFSNRTYTHNCHKGDNPAIAEFKCSPFKKKYTHAHT